MTYIIGALWLLAGGVISMEESLPFGELNEWAIFGGVTIISGILFYFQSQKWLGNDDNIVATSTVSSTAVEGAADSAPAQSASSTSQSADSSFDWRSVLITIILIGASAIAGTVWMIGQKSGVDALVLESSRIATAKTTKMERLGFESISILPREGVDASGKIVKIAKLRFPKSIKKGDKVSFYSFEWKASYIEKNGRYVYFHTPTSFVLKFGSSNVALLEPVNGILPDEVWWCQE